MAPNLTPHLVHGALVAALALSAPAVTAQDWRSELPAFRIDLLGGENEADRLSRNECMVEQVSDILGTPVEHYPASDYAGVADLPCAPSTARTGSPSSQISTPSTPRWASCSPR